MSQNYSKIKEPVELHRSKQRSERGKTKKRNYFQRILFLSFFSMSPMPSRTLVMSYIRLFCTCTSEIFIKPGKQQKYLNQQSSVILYYLQYFCSFIQVKDAILCVFKQVDEFFSQKPLERSKNSVSIHMKTKSTIIIRIIWLFINFTATESESPRELS